ncbi:MAG: MAC/perforin domain-containing protein [Roseovarius sp.]
MRQVILSVAVMLLAVVAPPRAEAQSEAAVALFRSWVADIQLIGLGESVTLPPIHYGYNEVLPSDAEAEALGILAEILAFVGADTFRLSIRGHSDGVGAPRQIEAVARSRARFVAEAMARKVPLSEFMSVSISGSGAANLFNPAVPDDPKNRRVEITLTRAALPETPPVDWDFSYGAPDEAEQFAFDADTPERAFTLPAGRLDGIVRGTIDLWFSAEWTRPLGHDPALFTVMDGEEVRFSLHVLDGRNGLAIWDGTEEGYVGLREDITDFGPIHVALVTAGAQTHLLVNGTPAGPPLPTGYGAEGASRIILGAGPDGADRFTGRIAQVRLWNEALSPADWPLLTAPEPMPGLASPLRPSLVARTATDAESGLLALVPVEAFLAPTAGWFSPMGRRTVRIENRPEFEAGNASPLMSRLQLAWSEATSERAAQVGPGEFAAAIEAQADAEQHPHFSTQALVKLQPAPGVSADTLTLPIALRGRVRDRHDWRDISNFALVIEQDATGITGLRFDRCPTPRRLPPPSRNCDVGSQPGNWFAFDGDEYLRGISWAISQQGHLRDLRLYTNERASIPRGVQGMADDPAVQRYEVFLPDGVRPEALLVHFADAVRSRPIGLELVPPPGIERPAVTLYSDTGEAVRFARVSPGQFMSLSPAARLFETLGAQAPAFPYLTVIDAGRLSLEGLDADLLLLEEFEPPQPKDNFNDTFVSLSKAVNLQANYTGYHILHMDPLHLTRTGTQRHIFDMPDGETRDYYDANRIFVPRGLFYTPEFTGRNHSTVHSSDTYAEFRDSFSDTVSAGIDGKLAPASFKFSSTMSEARASISENKISRTMGLSRAIFYDLVLDKSQMKLTPEFRADVARLAETRAYEEFVEVYGTHYASAVVYGGLGVLEIDATETMRETMHQQGLSMKLELGVLLDAKTETKASVGYEHDEEHAKAFRNIVGNQTENFYWIGGTHAGAEHSGWTVGTDGVVPIHVVLRPIDELISPVFFDDPELHVRVRTELKRWLAGEIVRAGQGLPGGVSDPYWMFEVRIDGVACTAESPTSETMPLGRHSHPKQFPMIFSRVYRADGLFMRNYVNGYSQADANPDEDYQAMKVTCPSQENMIIDSPYMQAHKLARFRLHERQLVNGFATLELLDRRDLEHFVIYPPPHTSKAEKRSAAFLAGLTLGISVLVQEYLTEDGSPIVNHDDAPPKPDLNSFKVNVLKALCRYVPGNTTDCTTLDADDLEYLSGRWLQGYSVSRSPEGCDYCMTRRVDFSMRVFQ